MRIFQKMCFVQIFFLQICISKRRFSTGCFFVTAAPLKVLSVRLHSKSHQKSSKCQKFSYWLTLRIFRGAAVTKDTLYNLFPFLKHSFQIAFINSGPVHFSGSLDYKVWGKVCSSGRLYHQLHHSNTFGFA